MSWVKFDDRLPDNLKLQGVSSDAFRAYVESLCVTSAARSDGVVGRRTADTRWPGQAGELLQAGLWEAHADGYYIPDYQDFYPAREAQEVLARRRTAGKRAGGLARASTAARGPGGRYAPRGQPDDHLDDQPADQQTTSRLSSRAPADITSRRPADHPAEHQQPAGPLLVAASREDPISDSDLPPDPRPVRSDPPSPEARARANGEGLSEAEAELLAYLHERIRTVVYEGADGPPAGWSEDLVRQGLTRDEVDALVRKMRPSQASRPKALAWGRKALEGLLGDREPAAGVSAGAAAGPAGHQQTRQQGTSSPASRAPAAMETFAAAAAAEEAVWQAVLAEAGKGLSRGNVDTWLSDLHLGLRGQETVVVARSGFVVEWVQKRRMAQFVAACEAQGMVMPPLVEGCVGPAIAVPA